MEPETRISFGSWTALASTVAAGVAVAGGFDAGPNLVPAVEAASLRSTAQAATKMVFSGGNGRIQDFDIYVGSAEGGDLVDLSTNEVCDSGPVFSPNGRQIAFHSDRHGDRDDPPSERNFEVYVMNVDGTNVRRLTNRPGWDGSPSWSPDGRKIAWGTCRVEEGGKCDVAVMDADGSGVTLLTDSDDHFDNSPRWSPNDREITYGGRDGPSIIDAEGTNLRRLELDFSGRTISVSDWSHP